MKSVELRNRFFDYFVRNGHTLVPSSGLIPAQDPTILFTNAGMNQFKDLFLGKEKRAYKRAVSIQKCVRAGGKHNDLDNVGFTKRHLTFFEMCGNFSFGDYFKKEAIEFAWQFLTQEIQLPVDRLYVTVYKDDNEAYDIWHKHIGLDTSRIFRLGEADNFWSMGDTGPCGPCTEIMYDRGAHTSPQSIDGDITSCSERYMEIWNLVFMQYNRQADSTLEKLTQTGVDTGMGLERLCVVSQEKDSVYETDLFTPIINRIEKLTGTVYESQTETQKAAFRVLADHIRSASMIIADGCLPSNEGRGYVLRKIIRRAALFERKITTKSIFAELSAIVVEEFGSIYPEVVSQASLIKKTLATEIEKFSYNLERGSAILEQYFMEQTTSKEISGKQAFRLYDTFGFPLEITDAMARQRGFTVDTIGFEHEMDAQRAQSSVKTAKSDLTVKLPDSLHTEFTGYGEHTRTSPITCLIEQNTVVTQIQEGHPCWIITQQTPFYVECGGQVNDEGTIAINGKLAQVRDLKKIDGAIALHCIAPTTIKVGDEATMQVNSSTRLATMKNHTATHLLQAALINILGPSVKQAGSIVTPEYLRFDFTHTEALTPEQIQQIEHIVNAKIWENIPLHIQHTSLQAAQKDGVIAFFGEKYNPEKVRVIRIPGFSAELCGGTHVHATGDIGAFKITESTALAAGTRRIVAVTGPKALETLQETFNAIKKLSQEFKVRPSEVLESINGLRTTIKDQSTEIKRLKKQLFEFNIDRWLAHGTVTQGVPVTILEVADYDADDLKEIMGLMLDKKPGLYVIINRTPDKIGYMAAVSPMYTKQAQLRTLAQRLAQEFEMKGGGSHDLIQGGGKQYPHNLQQIIQEHLKQAQ